MFSGLVFCLFGLDCYEIIDWFCVFGIVEVEYWCNGWIEFVLCFYFFFVSDNEIWIFFRFFICGILLLFQLKVFIVWVMLCWVVFEDEEILGLVIDNVECFGCCFGFIVLQDFLCVGIDVILCGEVLEWFDYVLQIYV